MRVLIIDPSVSLLLDAVGLIVAQDWEPAGWPRPVDDRISDQVPPDPPDRPGSACGAERFGPPPRGPAEVSKPRFLQVDGDGPGPGPTRNRAA